MAPFDEDPAPGRAKNWRDLFRRRDDARPEPGSGSDHAVPGTGADEGGKNDCGDAGEGGGDGDGGGGD